MTQPEKPLRYSELDNSMLFVLRCEAALGNPRAAKIIEGHKAWRLKQWRTAAAQAKVPA